MNPPIREMGVNLGLSNLSSPFTGVRFLGSGFFDVQNNIHFSGGVFYRRGLPDSYGMQGRWGLQAGFNVANFAGEHDPGTTPIINRLEVDAQIGGVEDNFFESPEVEAFSLFSQGTIGSVSNLLFALSIIPEFTLTNPQNRRFRAYTFAGLNTVLYNQVNARMRGSGSNDPIALDAENTPSEWNGRLGLPIGFGLNYYIGNGFSIGLEIHSTFTWGNYPSGIKHPDGAGDHYLSNVLKIGYRLR